MHRASLIAFLALLPIAPSRGAVDVDISSADRIEEDWQVVIGSPDVDVTSPQILTAMIVGPSGTSPTFEFALNYRDSPQFIAGGVQVKARSGDQELSASSQKSEQLATADESITWTQQLSLSGGNLKFQVKSGQSTTWGSFGGGSALTVSTPSALGSLSGYDPATSVLGSGPSFGGNRVSTMTLLRVRYYHGNQLLTTDATPRSVEVGN